MAAMHLRFASDDLVARLITVTGGRANLIAIACNEILKALNPEARVIESADLDKALDSGAIEESLLGWGTLLGRDREDETRIDRIIVYATAEAGTFTQKALLQQLEALDVQVTGEAINRALKRLELAFVLGREKRTYTYQVPLFRDMVLDDGCEEMLRWELKR
jgi:hypothetical protein